MATGRYLLIAFSSRTKIQISNWISASKAGSAGANRSVSCLRESPLAPNLRSCPCVTAALSGSPTFLRGHGTVSRSRRLMQFSRCGADMKNCRPVARLQILSEYKENRPARDQRILSEESGGKMVRCGCRAAIYHSKVVCMD